MHVIRLLVVLFILVSSSCTLRFARIDNQEIISAYLKIIQEYNKQVSQLRASLDIRGTGILGSFVHEQADIIVREPSYLFWSLRSFFGPPATVVAVNKKYITLFDFTSNSPNSYQKFPMSDDSVFEMFDFAFHPASLIPLVLAQIPIEKARDISLSKSSDIMQLTAYLPHDWLLTTNFNTLLNRPIETKLEHKQTKISYAVKYLDFVLTNGTYFPTTHVLVARNKSKLIKFSLSFSNIILNGEQISDDKFFLQEY